VEAVSIPDRDKRFLFSTTSGLTLVLTQLLTQWATGDTSAGVKRPGREADHSPPSSAEVKNCGATRIFSFPYTSSWRGAELSNGARLLLALRFILIIISVIN
jgi:hypothetical protein